MLTYFWAVNAILSDKKASTFFKTIKCTVFIALEMPFGFPKCSKKNSVKKTFYHDTINCAEPITLSPCRLNSPLVSTQSFKIRNTDCLGLSHLWKEATPTHGFHIVYLVYKLSLDKIPNIFQYVYLFLGQGRDFFQYFGFP